MNPSEQNDTAASPRKRKSNWVLAGFFVLLVIVAVSILPRGFSDDLSRIGKGTAAIVLIRDKNAVQAMDLMEVLNEVRGQYAGRIEFLLTDFDTPQGRAFIAAHGAQRVTLVLLDAEGKLVKMLYPPQTAASVRQEIAGSLGVQP